MRYGTQIGKKFHTNGAAAAYPGNTVVSDAEPHTHAYRIMSQCLGMLRAAGLDGLFIPLPEDSYHMTVIRGVNDLVRDPLFWPPALPPDAPMTQVDDYMEAAIGSVPPPGVLRMRFGGARITEEDFRISMLPADEAQERALRQYRDRVADAIGLRLQGHDSYTFHITLAYTWRLPDARQEKALAALRTRMDDLLAQQPVVELPPPHAAFYRDMLHFSARRIGRAQHP